MLGAHRDAARARHVRGNHLAQFGQTLGGTVVRPALVERLFGGFRDVRRGREIGLADFEVDHVLPLGFQGAGAHQYFKRQFDPDAGHSLCGFHGLPRFQGNRNRWHQNAGSGGAYLPMQKVLKMRLRMSSAVVAPVMASIGRSAA